MIEPGGAETDRVQIVAPNGIKLITVMPKAFSHAILQGMLTNRKHEIFAREIAAGEGLEASYLAAGYKPGRSARFNASRLRNRPDVRKRIEELLEQFNEQSALKLEYLQRQLLPVLQSNPQDLFERGTTRLKTIAALPREVAAAIKSVKFDKQTGALVEITLADKIAAANVLLRSIGAIRDDQGKTILAILEKRVREWTEDDLRIIEARLSVLGLPPSPGQVAPPITPENFA
jgi:phage terminase small subunit